MSESEVQQLIQIEGPKYGCVLERNNSGAFKNANGDWYRFGLGNISEQHAKNMRSSDLVGITTVTVTQEMVGQKIGVFTAIEVKSPDWKRNKVFTAHEKAQLNWLEWVKKRGGIAAFCNSVDSFRLLLGK